MGKGHDDCTTTSHGNIDLVEAAVGSVGSTNLFEKTDHSTMLIKRGIAVSPGTAIGQVLVLGTETFRIPSQFVSVDAVDTEIARFHSAVDAVCREIGENEQIASDHLGKQYGAIFAAHQQLIRDPDLIEKIEFLIRDNCYAPEFAVSKAIRHYARMFQSLGNRYMAERVSDLFDLEKRMLRQLLGQSREELANLSHPVIILAKNLTPSETAALDKRLVLGFATEAGGRTSHTAILAGALEIPAVVGIGRFMADVAGGETVIIDGDSGEIIIDPSEETLKDYRRRFREQQTEAARQETFADVEPITKDNVRVSVMGNIEFPTEVEHCVSRGADGIGLYRTEFLYLQTDVEPDEQTHLDAYRAVLREAGGQPVIIRTLDLGVDKVPPSLTRGYPEQAAETHSALGLRSIRLSLQHLPLFKTQLRALLRASVDGDVRIMFPLISTLMEFRKARMIFADVMEDLEEEGVDFRRDIPLGMMVETPSAALLAEEFAREVDFFSIGTNDLIQYTLAVDRAETLVSSLYTSGDPAVLRLIDRIIKAAVAADIPVSVCGQMASDPDYVPLLIGMGLRQVSVTPHAIGQVKAAIRRVSVEQAEAIATHVLSLETARDVESYLRNVRRRQESAA
ncbi:phosphoenolpyruvate--protein phosphotransferase [Stratiformator vulcanicus]|uniref:Phosphoenolpyruvate-protein phosphotransferase n=1 Tax=Stratiformator vulcanicus TaxID=2527980 RepID=A0A517R466_9PLAN|nr:phosphoenolpyruvate--protein phosphotransferase [Stratiformator vulcanicus]QDT38661.1 Phosphoenolpyruvate-protein phosphotransferase [Stratiformator vulcanicus]